MSIPGTDGYSYRPGRFRKKKKRPFARRYQYSS